MTRVTSATLIFGTRSELGPTILRKPTILMTAPSKEKLREIKALSFTIHNTLTDLLEVVEIEDNSGQLTTEYTRLTTALLGCKIVIEQMGKMSGDL